MRDNLFTAESSIDARRATRNKLLAITLQFQDDVLNERFLIVFEPAHPGELLKEDILAETGLNVAKAAEILGVGRPALSSVLNGKANLSPEMALRFEKAFGASMELLLKMQLQYDISKTRKAEKGIKVQRRKKAA